MLTTTKTIRQQFRALSKISFSNLHQQETSERHICMNPSVVQFRRAMRFADRLILGAALNITAVAQTPAFTGAVGFGATATGGRGGKVHHVRNLYDSSPGSFRDTVTGVIMAKDRNGQLDGLRVESSPRSPNWVRAAYQNVASNPTFSSVSPVSIAVLPSFSVTQLTNGQPNCCVAGSPGFACTLQASSNLIS